MKLRNKKTGKIIEWFNNTDGIFPDTLAELTEEWEDYEEPHYTYWIDTREERIVQADLPITDNCFEYIRELGLGFATKEEAEQAVEKLKAWKRLKDKDFRFHGYDALGCGEITFSLDFEDMDDEGKIGQLKHDLDLLFGGEEC